MKRTSEKERAPMMESLEGRTLLSGSHTVSPTKLTFSTTAVDGTIANPISQSVAAKITANGLPLRTATVYFVMDGQYALGTGTSARSGYVTLAVPNIFAGKHTIAAYFTGATRYKAGQSAAKTVTVTVPSLTTTSDGLEYATITAGSGAAAAAGQTATVDYAGFLTTGSLFDTSIKANADTAVYDTPLGEPLGFSLYSGSTAPNDGLTHAVVGFNEGLIGMKVGETRLLVIPSAIGYGSTANGAIPANSTLVFYVKLEGISG